MLLGPEGESGTILAGFTCLKHSRTDPSIFDSLG